MRRTGRGAHREEEQVGRGQLGGYQGRRGEMDRKRKDIEQRPSGIRTALDRKEGDR